MAFFQLSAKIHFFQLDTIFFFPFSRNFQYSLFILSIPIQLPYRAGGRAKYGAAIFGVGFW